VRKAIKKRRRETREDFSRRRKVHAFRGESALEKSLWKFPRRKEKFSSKPRTTKGKTSFNGYSKTVSAQIVIVSAVHALVACSPTSSIPTLLHLQPAAACPFLRLRPSPGTRAAAAAAAALLPLSPAVHTSASRVSCPRYPTPGTFYVAAAAIPVAVLTPRPSRHQPLSSAAYQGRAPLTTTIGRDLTSPLRGRFRAFFIYPHSRQN
jgi:hypothetical protein